MNDASKPPEGGQKGGGQSGKKSPRFSFGWVVIVLLLVLVIAFRFTGRLLPWDAVGHGATLAGLAALEQVPLLGDVAARWLKGGDAFGAKSLGRFYTTHALILPWLVVFFVTVHLYLLRRHGLQGGDR